MDQRDEPRHLNWVTLGGDTIKIYVLLGLVWK